ncbi:MAG: hypothetical protein HC824_11655 [Synechococcales cyanobacterium RM1_1_8]|nr:hypothetical protein [Synechococcales cyanobacterium RM1_1_8]
MYLVLLETSGNQSFIFSTNKLRENLGASELIYRTGTRSLLRSVQASCGVTLWASDARTMRQNLLHQTSIEDQTSTIKVEVILATSGKALLLVEDRATAQDIIRRTTLSTLKQAPGVDLCGVYEQLSQAQSESLGDLIHSKIGSLIYEHLSHVRARRPGPQSRFQRLPVTDECVTSGLPARYLKSRVPEPSSNPNRSQRQSAVSRVKEGARLNAADRINQLIQDRGWRFAKNIDELQKSANRENQDQDKDWVAIVHADGNGLGQVFLEFDQYVQKIDGEAKPKDYFSQLRAFSIWLDECTEAAFLNALETTFGDWARQEQEAHAKQQRDASQGKAQGEFRVVLPLVPLILGGDDLTVMCSGHFALPFTAAFLRAFEKQTGQAVGADSPYNQVKPLVKEALGSDRLSACAGVAIVKPHFPFSIAYDLAEKLITSAKATKKKVISAQNFDKPYPCSAIDFHILYDSSNVDLEAIRDRLKQDGDLLYNKPYVVTHLEDLESNVLPDSYAWAKQHHWSHLEKRVVALLKPAKDGNGRLLANNQAHTLRQSLFTGRDASNAQLSLIWHRYNREPEDKAALRPLLQTVAQASTSTNDQNGIDSLFEPAWLPKKQSPNPPSAKDSHPSGSTQLTGFLDAIEAVGFMPEAESSAARSAETSTASHEQTLSAS